MGRRRKRYWLGLAMLALVVGACMRPVGHVLRAKWRDVDEREPVPPGYVDDASRLNRTPVAEVWRVAADPAEAERQLAELLRRAAQQRLPVSIAGARHSMGGHSIAADGIVVDMTSWKRLSFDDSRAILTAQSGAKWNEIIPYLDARGRSVAVMQSNDSFTVGGSVSVNCHGWQADRPPMASTVESLRVMLADGSIVHCSRQENAELFSLVLGGYGLFGVVLDVELRTVPNERYRLERHVVLTDELPEQFARPDAAMIFARLNVTPAEEFREAVLCRFVPEEGPVPALHSAANVPARRWIFRGAADGDYGKALRWRAETKWQAWIDSEYCSRNQLLHEGVETFENRSAESTDILHEYFVPPTRLAEFMAAMRPILREHHANLLNVTVREVQADADTRLRYADQPLLALVMLFVQPCTEAGEAEMESLTRELIDAALAHGGRYYLPYRLHATPEQFRAAYPQAEEFFALKRKYDPEERFSNRFYETYGAPSAPAATPSEPRA